MNMYFGLTNNVLWGFFLLPPILIFDFQARQTRSAFNKRKDTTCVLSCITLWNNLFHFCWSFFQGKSHFFPESITNCCPREFSSIAAFTAWNFPQLTFEDIRDTCRRSSQDRERETFTYRTQMFCFLSCLCLIKILLTACRLILS